MLITTRYLPTCFAQWIQTDGYGGGNDFGFHRGWKQAGHDPSCDWHDSVTGHEILSEVNLKWVS